MCITAGVVSQCELSNSRRTNVRGSTTVPSTKHSYTHTQQVHCVVSTKVQACCTSGECLERKRTRNSAQESAQHRAVIVKGVTVPGHQERRRFLCMPREVDSRPAPLEDPLYDPSAMNRCVLAQTLVKFTHEFRRHAAHESRHQRVVHTNRSKPLSYKK